MLLTLTTTHSPATDLGYLLHKSPFRPQSFELPFGKVHVFYPEATSERCTAALLIDIDPVGLVRNRRGPESEGGLLAQYVNDRPYVASSLLSVALARVLGTAMSGRCSERPELAQSEIPLEVGLTVLPCAGGEDHLRRLFEPLGYAVTASRHALDDTFPEWGASRYFTVVLQARKRLADLLSHLYVLVPVLDDEKHYWVGQDEVEKLLRHGEGWLTTHPERELITRRYLKHQRSLTREALSRLADEDVVEPDEREQRRAQEEAALEASLSLNDHRLNAVVGALKESGARRVLDLGCGDGKLLKQLLLDRSFTEIVGMDVAFRSLEVAKERLELDRLPEMQRQRLKLLHGSLLYRDRRLAGFDAAAIIEVIEHLDSPRLSAFERVVFEFARPATAIVTTPNVEYNVKFERLIAGAFRHRDHRFEWNRTQFGEWASDIGKRFGYSARLLPIGPEDATVGAPTQMAVFAR